MIFGTAQEHSETFVLINTNDSTARFKKTFFEDKKEGAESPNEINVSSNSLQDKHLSKSKEEVLNEEEKE